MFRLSARKMRAFIGVWSSSERATVRCAGGGIRTPDSRIMIPLLYHLSYAGSAVQN